MYSKLSRRVLSKAIKATNIRVLSTSETTNSQQNCNDENSGNEEENKRKGNQRNRKTLATAAFVGSALLGAAAYQYYKKPNRQAFLVSLPHVSQKVGDQGEFIQGLPLYTTEEISKHATIEDRVWVTYKQGVYDVTKFVSRHPGGEVIMLAAGSSVEPFWLIYSMHKNPQVFNMLKTLRIGNLSAEDAAEATKDMSDPYANDPKRHRILKPTSMKPFNAEPPAALLVDSFITPNEIFYVRNHLPVPEIDPKTYELELECEGKSKTVVLSLKDIQNEKKFPNHSVTTAIMCAGNRRSEMTKVKSVKGLNWENAAIGNATWSGARLCDVLKAHGIKDDDKYQHIQFEGLDQDPTAKPYGASIPAWKAFDPRCDIILAYEMNGEPIPRDHGYPIRVIVPGVVGARNVKWLGRILLSENESDSHWQQNDYKGFSPSTDWDTVDFTKSPAIQELPVISSICRPTQNENVKVVNGMITVQGYAWSGGGQKIVRVDVTADGGDTWHVATIDHQDPKSAPQNWAWTLWTAKVPVPKKTNTVEIWAKAIDSNYNTQPESFKNIWNLRGVLSNAYHRVKVNLIT